MKPLAFCVVVIVSLSTHLYAVAHSQDSTSIKTDSVLHFSRPLLSVHAVMDSVRVYVDSEFVGYTPLDSVSLAEGMHILRFIHPQARLWINETLTETVFVHPAEIVERNVTFPDHILIASNPYGATVTADNRVIGVTPCYIRVSDATPFITLFKEGYRESTVPVSKTVNVSLEPLPGTMIEARLISAALTTNQSRTSLPIYLTTAATILTGTAAAYFKIKADNAYSDYRQNGDGASLDRVHRNDTYSGIALAACEVNLLALTFFLLSR